MEKRFGFTIREIAKPTTPQTTLISDEQLLLVRITAIIVAVSRVQEPSEAEFSRTGRELWDEMCETGVVVTEGGSWQSRALNAEMKRRGITGCILS